MNIVRTAVISIAALVLFLLALELLFRVVVYLDKGSVEDRYLVLPHATLGWSLNTAMQPKHLENRCGEPVELLPPAHHLLLKQAASGDGKRVLFLGDSYTHAHEVSNGRAYYDVFERLEAGRYAVYAVGVGGYGSLQEYLALEEVHPRVRPDIVLWQLTGNDVSNNVYELDDGSIRNNQRRRPYLLPTGAITLRDPGFWLFDVSEGFVYLFQKLLIVDHTYRLGLIDRLDSMNAPDPDALDELREQGLAVLDSVVGRAVEKYPETRFIGFSVDARYDRRYRDIFVANGAQYLEAFYREMRVGRRTDCLPLDNHWNHLGNEIAGKALSRRLRAIPPN